MKKMKLQLKPNSWSCLATSFAMALDITTNRFHELAGHDGGEIIFPRLAEPLNRRGFHYSEAVYVASNLGYSSTPYEVAPFITDANHTSCIPVYYGPIGCEAFNLTHLARLIAKTLGVIEVRTRQGNMHAVAYDTGIIYDPDGREFEYSQEACESRHLFTTRLWRIEKRSA